MNINWELLAEQKWNLVGILAKNERTRFLLPDESNALDGILNLIDAIQDEAEAAGQPVVWLTEDDD